MDERVHNYDCVTSIHMFDKILTKDEIIKMLEKFKNIYFYFKRDGCVTSIR